MKKFSLKNGIPVILAPMQGTQVITVWILFKVGSRNETVKNNGVSHFLEHLFFKGTEHRPTTLDISKELDGVGAEYNAFTSKEYTGYYVKVDTRHSKKAVNILADLLLRPLFIEEEVDRERGVICEEIKMYQDNPRNIAEVEAEALLFNKHPLGYDIAGPIANIEQIPRQSIINYRTAHYRTDNMVIVLSGKLPTDVRQLVRNEFEEMQKSTGRKAGRAVRFQYKQRSARVRVTRKPTAQANLVLSFPGPTHTSKDRYAYSVLSAILGGGMSSRLMINIREREGLCYDIRSSITAYEDMGAFSISAGVANENVKKTVHAITRELREMIDNGVTDEELKKGKDMITGRLSIRMEDSDNIAGWWASQELFGKDSAGIDEYRKRIRAVTGKEVQALARKLFDPFNANLSVVGPFNTSLEKTLRKQLQW